MGGKDDVMMTLKTMMMKTMMVMVVVNVMRAVRVHLHPLSQVGGR